MAGIVSPAETANRTRKALRIADVLIAHGCDVATAKAMPVGAWSMAAEIAGTKPPSVQTQAAVLAVLADSETASDPFAGF